MVHHQNNHNRYHKGLVEIDGEDKESQIRLVLNLQDHKKTRPKLFFPYLFLFLLLSCTFFFLPRLLALYSFQARNNGFVIDSVSTSDSPICSSMSYGSICCDRKSIRTDICLMKGDVRTHSASSSVFVYISDNSSNVEESDLIHERIKPYTRKWETSIMDTVDELELMVKKKKKKKVDSCQVQHSVPAVFFSTGGYTGNVYHEFNDGILPLYITSQHFNKNVVFVLLEYHDWWITKYADILSQLSNYPPIDFNTNQTHCFPEAIVGLNIHDELTIDSSLMEGNKTIRDFRSLLNQAYQPRIKGLVLDEQVEAKMLSPPSPPPQEEEQDKFIIPNNNNYKVNKKPKLVILSRNGSRAIMNQLSLVELAEEIGFQVEVLRPNPRMELAKIYMALNSSDVMLGVHGAAMTHFLFMRPSTVFIQVIPLGTDWAAQTYYGDPSIKLGLNYIPYKILPGESSLYTKFRKDDPVLRDPDSVNSKGWEFTKKFYLDGQNVKLNLRRFRKRLIRSYTYSISKRN